MARSLTETELGVLAASMSAVSAGLMLGRSAAWVERMRARLASEAQSEEHDEPERSPQPEPAPVAVDTPADPDPQSPQDRGAVAAEPTLTVWPEPAVELPARLKRWIGWFLKAGWTVRETACLFDLSPAELRAGMGLR